jgi:hypothetical protein
LLLLLFIEHAHDPLHAGQERVESEHDNEHDQERCEQCERVLQQA